MRMTKRPTNLKASERLVTPRKAMSTDEHIGAAITALRVERGVSRSQLAETLGISHQQMQKYESAKNRISASRLYEVCQVLGVPITRAFERLK